MDDVKQRAVDVMGHTKTPHFGCGLGTSDAKAFVDALSAAGLLVTPLELSRRGSDLHERALEACKRRAENDDRALFHFAPSDANVIAIGREAIAAESDKSEGPWWVDAPPSTTGGVQWRATWSGYQSLPFDKESQARAVVAALNEVWRKERANA